jgi:hypothetical protein
LCFAVRARADTESLLLYAALELAVRLQHEQPQQDRTTLIALLSQQADAR